MAVFILFWFCQPKTRSHKFYCLHGGESLVLDANYPPAGAPPPGGGDGRGDCGRGERGGGGLGGFGGGGGVQEGWLEGGRVQVGQCGGHMPPRPSVGPSQAPLTSPCPPSNHTINLNLTLTFAVSWFGHAGHVD